MFKVLQLSQVNASNDIDGNRFEKPNQIHQAAFRSFGGGTTLCPGRHFATNEIVGLVTLLLVTFDINPAESDRIVIPERKDNVLPIHILKPQIPVKVKIQRRGISDVSWSMVV
jgi:cytochrome P450